MTWVANLATIVFVSLVLTFGFRGYRAGFLRSLEGIITLLVAAIIGYFYLDQLVALLNQHTPLEAGALAYALAAAGLLVACLIGVKLLFALMRRLLPGGGLPSMTSRLSGSVIGAGFGALLGLSLVYLLSVYDESRQESYQEPDLYAASRAFFSGAADRMAQSLGAEEDTRRLARNWVRSPVATGRHVNNVAQNEDLQFLLNDESTRHLIAQGDVDGLLAQPAYRDFLGDESVQALMRDAGMEADSPDAARETAEKLTQAWQQIQLLDEDPRIREIVEDPEFRSQIENDDLMPLLNNPKLPKLMRLVWTEGSANMRYDLDTEQRYRLQERGTPPPDESGQDTGAEADGDEEAIYYWVDEDGVRHYSDRED